MLNGKLKSISAATLLIFALSSSVSAVAPSTAAPKTEFLPISNLAIPKSLGKIEERFVGKGDRWVIHIQDVHAHFTAQENIAAIVDHLNAVYGIKAAALEGGWNSTTFPISWGIPDSRQKTMLARLLMEDAYLTGPGYAALFSQTPINLVGIEDPKLYDEGHQLYVKHLNQRSEIQNKIDALSKKIAVEKQSTFNPELQSFDHSLADFREGKKAEKFMPSLIALADSKKVNLSDLDQVVLFKQILASEGAIQKEKLEDEAKRLTAKFKNERLTFEELVRNGKINPEKLEFYPEAAKYVALLKFQDKLVHRELFSQIEQTITRVKEKLITHEEERALDAKSERFVYAKKILLFQATPDDLKVYENQKADFESLLSENGLTEGLDLALQFYANAKKRDEIFFQKITTDPALGGNIVVVTGGFHTEGLTERLGESGTNYVVITPDLANETPNEDLYFKRMQIEPAKEETPETQTMPPVENFLIRAPRFDRQLGAALPTAEKNLSQAEQMTIQDVYPIGPATVREGPSAAAQIITAAVPLVAIDENQFTGEKALSKEQQMAIVRSWLNQIKKSSVRTTIMTRTSSLKKLFEDEVALALWTNYIAPERANTLAELRDIDEYLDATMGPRMRAQVIRIPFFEPSNTIEEVLQQNRFKDRQRARQISIIDDHFKTTSAELLVLPVEPISLLLARLGGSGTYSSQFISTLNGLLREIFVKDGLLAKSA